MARLIGTALASLLLSAAGGSAVAKDDASQRWWLQPMFKSTPATQGFRLPAPGYIAIDNRWYVFSGPNFANTLHILPMRNGNGFTLSGWSSPRNCRAEPLLPTPPTTNSRFLIQEGTTPIVDLRLWGPANDPAARAQIRMTVCMDTPVLSITSNSGRLICDGQISAPFTTTQCPVLGTLLRPAATTIPPLFRSGFESL
jgi:hypothetical protein